MSRIPPYQRALFWIMLFGSLLMAIVLIRMRERAHESTAAVHDPIPIAAPVGQPPEPVTFDIANDTDGSLTPEQMTIALPQEPGTRVRALLERLLADYSLPQSTHPLTSGNAIEEIFLVPLTGPRGQPDPLHQLAVVNLRSSFVENHPSGIEVETLTLLSIAGTLHANMPSIEQVRFLVDGQQRQTLAGHADLTRAYLTSGPSSSSIDTTFINKYIHAFTSTFTFTKFNVESGTGGAA